MTNPGDTTPPPRDLWRDLFWGVSRGVALACLPVVLTVLPGRLPLSAADPRLGHSADSSLAILGLGAGLGAVTGLLRPLTRSLVGSLCLGLALAEAALVLVRTLVPTRADAPPIRPLGAVLLIGLILGLALYLGELYGRERR